MARYDEDIVYTSLDQALNDYYNVDNLKAMAKLICDRVPTRKAELVEAISTTMKKKEVKTIFEKLTKIEQSAVAEALYAPDGKFNQQQFKAKYLQMPKLGCSQGYRSEGYLIDLFIINNQIADDIRECLKAFIRKPKLDCVKYVSTLPTSIESDIQGEEKRPLKMRETANPALNNLQTTLMLIDSGKLKVSQKTCRPTLTTIKNLARLLKDGDWYEESDTYEEIKYIQAFAWPIIVQGSGLARAEGSILRLSNAGKKALNQNLPDIIKIAWMKWVGTKIIDEFSRIDNIKGQKSAGGRTLTVPSTRREVINKALCNCLPGNWVSVAELTRYMHSKGLEFEVARYAWKLYICDPQYGNLNDYYSWDLIEGRYLLAFLFEYAATLGLIDVAYIHPDGARSDYYDCWGVDDMDFLSRYDGLMYIRINSLGAYVLGMTDQYICQPIETDNVLKVLPNHEIVVTDVVALSPADKLFLDKTCKKISSSVWRITMQSMLNSAQAGTMPDEIQRFFKNRSSLSIPETVRILLNDAQKRTTYLKYSGRAHLIECEDPILVKLITSNKNLAKMCLSANDRFIIVLPGNEKAFLKELERLGYIVCQFKEQV